MREPVEIRPMTEEQIASAMKLKELENWNQTAHDWRRLIRLEPQGCFIASIGERLIGTTTTTTYGRDLAWIGMVLVDPEYRRRGVATRLLGAAIDYLKSAGVFAIKLDATPAGQPLYEILGFAGEVLIERWQAVARPIRSSNRVAIEAGDLSSALSLDRRAFGADRGNLLDLLKADSPVKPLIATAPDGQVTGYVMARRGAQATYIGPLVAADPQAATALLDGMLDQLAGENVSIDFHTGFKTGDAMLGERGFVRQRNLLRMYYGNPSPAGTSQMIFAIAGLEFG
jgi:GNAT superfamily N-acetyltransferase